MEARPVKAFVMCRLAAKCQPSPASTSSHSALLILLPSALTIFLLSINHLPPCLTIMYSHLLRSPPLCCVRISTRLGETTETSIIISASGSYSGGCWNDPWRPWGRWRAVQYLAKIAFIAARFDWWTAWDWPAWPLVARDFAKQSRSHRFISCMNCRRTCADDSSADISSLIR